MGYPIDRLCSNFHIHKKKMEIEKKIILLRICFSSQEKLFPTIAPSKHMQTLLIHQL